jgi:hypothetical protein
MLLKSLILGNFLSLCFQDVTNLIEFDKYKIFLKQLEQHKQILSSIFADLPQFEIYMSITQHHQLMRKNNKENPLLSSM